jgi:hypothetical protein
VFSETGIILFTNRITMPSKTHSHTRTCTHLHTRTTRSYMHVHRHIHTHTHTRTTQTHSQTHTHTCTYTHTHTHEYGHTHSLSLSLSLSLTHTHTHTVHYYLAIYSVRIRNDVRKEKLKIQESDKNAVKCLVYNVRQEESSRFISVIRRLRRLVKLFVMRGTKSLSKPLVGKSPEM